MMRKRCKKIITLIMALAVTAVTALPAGVFADTNSDEGYIYKYIGTDNNNKGCSISYYDTGKKHNTSGSTIMFKLKKDNENKVDLAYCCDLDTYAINNTYYKRTNLENAGYFDPDTARNIRNVVVNGFDPANSDSAEKLKEAVNAWAENRDMNERVDDLTDEEAVTATQLAIWSLANPEMKPSSESSTVTLVKDYLVNLPERAAAPDETAAECLDITATADKDKETGNLSICGTFNFFSEPEAGKTKVTPKGDDIVLDIKVGEAVCLSGNLKDLLEDGAVKLDQETLDYSYEIKSADDGSSGEAVVEINVSGIQDLPRGAYFYKTPDRKDSQNFVGIADWDKNLVLSGATKANVVEPETSAEPEEPAVPADPIEPDAPAEPETSADPVVPAGPEAPELPDMPCTPKTGDDSSLILWGMMAITSLAIMAVSMLIRRKEG